jgi:inhibitor of cysteine peptidase
MKKIKVLFGMLFMVGLLLSACQPAEETPVGDEYTYGQNATVESVEVLILESFPLQAQAIVTGYLPDGCTELHEITVERDGQDFILTIETRRPTGDIACTEAIVPFEETVTLEIADLESGIYTVVAQDQSATFILDVDNIIEEEQGDEKFNYGSRATVEQMVVNVMESFPVQISVQLEGYLPDGCTEIHEITTAREGQIFTVSIITRHPAGDVACTQAIVPFEETVSLDVEGLAAGEYTVITCDLSDTFTLEVDN